MTNTDQLSPQALAQFTGSEQWYRHALNRKVVFTEGAKHVADAGGAYWLLDEIALTQLSERIVNAESFQVWKLTVDLAAHTGELVCEDGNDVVVYRKTVTFTDFPIAEITLWFTDHTILLPSEY